jgi:hypothetical protein
MTAPKNETEKPHRSAASIASLAAVLAAIVPGTAAINGCYQVQLEQEKHKSEVRLKYLDRAINTEQKPEYREGVLDFLVETAPASDPMHSWAKKQLEKVRLVLQLRSEINALKEEQARVIKNLSTESALREKAQQDATRALEREQILKEKIEKSAGERERALQEQLAASEIRLRELEGSLRAAELKASIAQADDNKARSRSSARKYDSLRGLVFSQLKSQNEYLAPGDVTVATFIETSEYQCDLGIAASTGEPAWYRQFWQGAFSLPERLLEKSSDLADGHFRVLASCHPGQMPIPGEISITIILSGGRKSTAFYDSFRPPHGMFIELEYQFNTNSPSAS